MLKDFRIFQAAIQFYQMCKPLSLPEDIKRQLMRAAQSIGGNLGEGYGRILSKDKRRFYRISFGSVRECQTIFLQEEIKDPKLTDLLDYLAGGVYKLIR